MFAIFAKYVKLHKFVTTNSNLDSLTSCYCSLSPFLTHHCELASGNRNPCRKVIKLDIKTNANMLSIHSFPFTVVY